MFEEPRILYSDKYHTFKTDDMAWSDEIISEAFPFASCAMQHHCERVYTHPNVSHAIAQLYYMESDGEGVAVAIVNGLTGHVVWNYTTGIDIEDAYKIRSHFDAIDVTGSVIHHLPEPKED